MTTKRNVLVTGATGQQEALSRTHCFPKGTASRR